MKIKRFNESANSDKWLIDEYFSDITDNELGKDIQFYLDEINENLFEIGIYAKVETLNAYQHDIYDTLEFFEKKLSLKNKIYSYIKSSILGILNEDVVDDVSVLEKEKGFLIKIKTKLKGNLDNWIILTEDQYISHDERRLKALLKEKFKINITHSSIHEEYDKYGERYGEMSLTFEKIPTKEQLKNLEEYFLSITKMFEIYGEEEKVFVSFYHREGSDYAYLELNNMLSVDVD